MNSKSNINQDEFYTITQKEFWLKWFSKFMFTLISVKVWGLIACTWVSTYLLLCHEMVSVGDQVYELGITGAQWVTFNTTIWGLIFGMKEIFRVMDNKDRSDAKIIQEDNRTKEEIAKITASTMTPTGASGSKSTYTADGKEVVADEPN
ncbi:hypothetical protein [Sunxiuqinia dokdonensis]|uniref:Holin n=1 Tax=Sunxiuqinia dokdonensis TaxID=1409788 RepID=A0A0L8VC94_9BACT|nr:hypothetical protein [Sunxiuqinia dokdonensis]KOH46076.1 hypothetical protein NC99_11010 [Sunxiuqinia dokdonensis]